jgi:hypothetical protein
MLRSSQAELNEARNALNPFPRGFSSMIVDRDLSAIATSTASAVDVLKNVSWKVCRVRRSVKNRQALITCSEPSFVVEAFHRSPCAPSIYFTFNLSTSKHRCPSLFFRPLRSEGTQPLQMAGSSKNGSIKSPKSPKSSKRGRNGKAAAAPEAKSVDVNNEDYNIRSPERTQLLTQLRAVLDNAPVSPAFWACCQLADMNCLQDLVHTKKRIILLFVKPLITLPMQCELLRF